MDQCKLGCQNVINFIFTLFYPFIVQEQLYVMCNVCVCVCVCARTRVCVCVCVCLFVILLGKTD